LRYRGTSYGNTTNTFKIDAVTLVDAAVHYDLGVLDTMLKGAEPAVNVSNLLDTEYVGRCQNNGCYYGLRRNVFGTVTYRW
jgi:iron complex outermembrane receptor protein